PADEEPVGAAALGPAPEPGEGGGVGGGVVVGEVEEDRHHGGVGVPLVGQLQGVAGGVGQAVGGRRGQLPHLGPGGPGHLGRLRVAEAQNVVADGVAGGEHREELVDGGQLRASSSATRASRAATRAAIAARSAACSASMRSSRSATASPRRAAAWPSTPTWWPRNRTYHPTHFRTACLTRRCGNEREATGASTSITACCSSSSAALRTSSPPPSVTASRAAPGRTRAR